MTNEEIQISNLATDWLRRANLLSNEEIKKLLNPREVQIAKWNSRQGNFCFDLSKICQINETTIIIYYAQ